MTRKWAYQSKRIMGWNMHRSRLKMHIEAGVPIFMHFWDIWVARTILPSEPCPLSPTGLSNGVWNLEIGPVVWEISGGGPLGPPPPAGRVTNQTPAGRGLKVISTENGWTGKPGVRLSPPIFCRMHLSARSEWPVRTPKRLTFPDPPSNWMYLAAYGATPASDSGGTGRTRPLMEDHRTLSPDADLAQI